MDKGCWFRENLGIYCSACGATRMVKSILKGDFYQAFRYNPLFFIMLILGTVWGIINVIRLIIHKKILWPKEWQCIGIAAVLVIYMILRNIPAFSFLIPTDIG